MSTRSHRVRTARGRAAALPAVLIPSSAWPRLRHVKGRPARRRRLEAASANHRESSRAGAKERTGGTSPRRARVGRSGQVGRRQHRPGRCRPAPRIRHTGRGRGDFQHQVHRLSWPAGLGNDQRSAGGGEGTLTGPAPVKTIGSYWPYATTIFDYVRRAMPYQAPHSLTDPEVYALTAYLLSLNGVIAKDAVMDARTLPQVQMPNRGNFILSYPGRQP